MVGFIDIFTKNCGSLFLEKNRLIFCDLLHFLMDFIPIFQVFPLVLLSLPLPHLAVHYFNSQQFVHIRKDQFEVLFYKFVFETGADYTVGTIVALRNIGIGKKEK